ncbi:hypothetical protein FO519_006637 [Halicephalobus sp. NKZ332]|nr:hypothetical protein FO519_006637 [Halicephalobus sp. NKZ332]
MGAHQSSPQLTLAEKRYRVGSPDRLKKRKMQKQKSTTGIEASTSTFNGSLKNKVVNGKATKQKPSDQISSRSNSDQLASLNSFSMASFDNCELLSKNQKQLIENSWKRNRKNGTDNIGTKIFLLILTAQPDIKMIFGLEKIPQGRLKYDPRFRKHALVFNRTFDYVIKNINYTEKLVQHFQTLGKKHAMLQGRGFLPQYWITFAECMTQTAIEWEGGQRSREAMVAWKILITFIIHQMKIGFDDENTNRRKFTLSQMPAPVGGICPMKYSPNLALIKNRSNSQQFLRPVFHDTVEKQLSCFERKNADPMKELSGKLQQCTLSPKKDFPEDNVSGKSVFFTPPSSRPKLKRGPSFPVYRAAGKDDSTTDIESDDDIWGSPKRHSMIR